MDIASKITKNFNLSSLTTFKIGGPANFFLAADNLAELQAAVAWAKERGEPLFILAGGSNVLISDQGIAGLVIKFSDASITIDNCEVNCGVGAALSQLVKLAQDSGLSGLEWAAGIPGTIGGAVYGNAGAFGEDIGRAVKNAQVYDINSDSSLDFDNQQCQFGYRDSIFKQQKNLIITKVKLGLVRGEKDEITAKINSNMQYRATVQPAGNSAGSVFKNLTLDYIKSVNPDLAREAESEGKAKGCKVAAGWVIDRAGLKGKQIGGAKVSEKHAGFIINTGQATADEIIQLISLIKQQIRNKYKIQLQEEIQYLGF